MKLDVYIETLRHEMTEAAELGGEEAMAMADKLTVPLTSSLRLVLLEALSDATTEITTELAPTSVEVRLRGRDPEFVVHAVPSLISGEAEPAGAENPASPEDSAETSGEPEGDMVRTTIRIPEGLKNRIDEAAAKEGVSVNTWLIHAASMALNERPRYTPREVKGNQRYVGWS